MATGLHMETVVKGSFLDAKVTEEETEFSLSSLQDICLSL